MSATTVVRFTGTEAHRALRGALTEFGDQRPDEHLVVVGADALAWALETIEALEQRSFVPISLAHPHRSVIRSATPAWVQRAADMLVLAVLAALAWLLWRQVIA